MYLFYVFMYVYISMYLFYVITMYLYSLIYILYIEYIAFNALILKLKDLPNAMSKVKDT